MAHTPGPWRQQYNSFIEEFEGWIENDKEVGICEYEGCGSHRASWLNPDDLKLVLAAPSLLKALKGLVGKVTFDCPELRQALEAICEAEEQAVPPKNKGEK